MVEQKEKTTSERFPLIAVVGAPGVGKSTYVDAFSRLTAARVLDEPYQENPYLKGFYGEDPQKYAFNAQMMFLTVRGLQLTGLREKLIGSSFIQDSTLDADSLMAHELFRMGYISKEDIKVYDRAKKNIVAMPSMVKPDLVIFLKADKKVIEQRIIERGREMELLMLARNPGYFAKLVDSYNRLFGNLGKNKKGVIEIDTSSHSNKWTDGEIEESLNWISYYLCVRHSKGLALKGSDGMRLNLPGFLRPGTPKTETMPGRAYDR